MEQATVTRLVAKRVRRLRMGRGWSALRLAEECARVGCESLDRGTIAKIESGARKKVTADELAWLALALGVTPTDLLTPERQTIVVVDVDSFTNPARTLVHQHAVRDGLFNVLKSAFAEAGVDPDDCMLEDRGDRVMILLPSGANNSQVADQLPGRLVAGLRRHNAVHPPDAQLKLRVALHDGEVRQDGQGVVGAAVDHTFRLIEAPQAISLLRSTSEVLALIVSDHFYRGVIVQDPATDPGSYRQLALAVDENSVVAWLRLPDHALTPNRSYHVDYPRVLGPFPREAISPVPPSPLLHLMIVVEPDGIDPDNLFHVSSWRQDDPAVWPPPRGETRVVAFEDLERCTDDLVMTAERAWSGHTGSVALEFVLPRELLSLPVQHWHRDHESGDPRPLSLDYPIVLRSLERMRSPHWHRVWRQRWKLLKTDPSTVRAHFAQLADTAQPFRIDAILSDPRYVMMVLSAAPTSEYEPGRDELTAALRAGLPVLLWHPEVSSEILRGVITRLVADDGLGDLPERTLASRRTVLHEVSGQENVNIIPGLVVLWDDPDRVVNLDQLE